MHLFWSDDNQLPRCRVRAFRRRMEQFVQSELLSFPASQEAAYRRFLVAAHLSLEIDDFDMAERIAIHADKLSPELPQARLVLVLVARGRRRWALANSLLCRLGRDFPGHALVEAATLIHGHRQGPAKRFMRLNSLAAFVTSSPRCARSRGN